MKADWTFDDMPAQAGKTVMITGANDGLGFHLTRAFAAKGAGTVIMACRNIPKAEKARAAILAELPDARLEIVPLDLGDLASVEACAAQVSARHSRLDILLCNAGLIVAPYGVTKDGLETQMGVNYYGHFSLVGRLLPVIADSPGARLVTLSSTAQALGRLDLDRPVTRDNYGRWRAYGDSKLAMLILALDLDRKFKEAGMDAMALCAHPGFSRTSPWSTRLRTERNPFRRLQLRFSQGISMSAERGILPILYAATDPQAQGGQFIGVSGFLEIHGSPKVTRGQRRAYDGKLARRLWKRSVEVTGVTYPFPGPPSEDVQRARNLEMK